MQLPAQLKRVLWMSSTFLVVFTYMSIFVNLYVWQRHHRISELSWYNIVLYVAWGIGFTIGANLLTRYSCRVPMRLSAIAGMVAFGLLSFLHLSNTYLWIAIVAVPVGLFGGFYYSGQNLSLTKLGRGEEFSAFYFYQSLINQVIGLVDPIVSALTIHWFGYRSSFVLMFVFVCVMFYMSYTVPKITYRNDLQKGEAFHHHMAWPKVFSTSNLHWTYLGLFVGGLFFQFQSALSLILTFSVTGSKIIIGLLSMGYTLACVVALRIYQHSTGSKSMWLRLGVVFISIGFVIAAIPSNPVRILSNFLTTVGMFYFSSVWNGQQYAMFSELSPMHMVRLFTWRENTFAIARIIVFGALFRMHHVAGVPLYILLAAVLICSGLVPAIQTRALRGYQPVES